MATLQSPRSLGSLDQLRDFVRQTLCERENLEPDAFPMTEQLLVKRGKPCGMYFCLHGPRAVKFSAIWELEGGTLLFYGSDGERFRKLHVPESPELAAKVA